MNCCFIPTCKAETFAGPLLFHIQDRFNKGLLAERVCRTIRNVSVDEATLLFDIEGDQLRIRGKPVSPHGPEARRAYIKIQFL